VNNTILIVDDETSNLKILSFILSPEYTVYTARDGQTALGIAEESQPGLILLDIIMPGMDGFEVLRALRASDKTRQIPVVFITGLTAGGLKAKEPAPEPAGYISKPFGAADVRAKVRMHIQDPAAKGAVI